MLTGPDADECITASSAGGFARCLLVCVVGCEVSGGVVERPDVEFGFACVALFAKDWRFGALEAGRFQAG